MGKAIRGLLDASPDLLSAKRVLGDRYLRPATCAAHRAWHAQMRVSELAQHSGNQLHAVGVGRKVVDGKSTDVACVRLYVTRKLPGHLLAAADALPAFIDGIPTDVVEAAPAFFAAPSPCSMRKLKQQRPAQGGISGANEDIQAGTLGARCRSTRAGEGADQFVLGNCHTLADFGRAAMGSSIMQPSAVDGGLAATRLAGLHRFVPILEQAGADNEVDAAIAKLDVVDSMGAGICTVGTIRGVAAASMGLRVHKHGRTTGYTAGVIDDPSIDVLIPLRRDDPTQITRFVDQIRIRPLAGQFVVAQPGDSGSLVLTDPTNDAVGLLFACPDNGSFAYASPIQRVLAALEIEFG